MKRMTYSGFLAMLVLGASAASAWSASAEDVDRRWLDRLDRDDRGAIEMLIGHAPPQISEKVQWHNVDEAPTWQGLRERVVVVQSWTSRKEIGRTWLSQAQDAVSEFSDVDVQLLAVHTPEGADNVEKYLELREIDVPVAVDASGEFCDSLGMYRRPVNFVIDRNGAVRYAGLNAKGLKEAVTKLVNEPVDPEACPKTLGDPANDAAFPEIVGSVRSARDMRGQKAPALHVEQWVTDSPDMQGKVVMVDFWATWCGPCVASIPKLNQYTERFGEDLVIVGLSNEATPAFQSGMKKRNLSLDKFNYALALDSSRKMQDEVQVRGIPHVIVMCSDWIVRWQGHPGSLNEQVLDQIIKANGGSGASGPPSRWAKR